MIHNHNQTPFLEHEGFDIRPGIATTIGIQQVSHLPKSVVSFPSDCRKLWGAEQCDWLMNGLVGLSCSLLGCACIFMQTLFFSLFAVLRFPWVKQNYSKCASGLLVLSTLGPNLFSLRLSHLLHPVPALRGGLHVYVRMRTGIQKWFGYFDVMSYCLSAEPATEHVHSPTFALLVYMFYQQGIARLLTYVTPLPGVYMMLHPVKFRWWWMGPIKAPNHSGLFSVSTGWGESPGWQLWEMHD